MDIQSNDTWTTKDGRQIPVTELSDNHLKRIWQMLTRQNFISQETLNCFLYGPEPNGEMAKEAYDMAFTQVLESPVCNQMDAIERELTKRGFGDWTKKMEEIAR